MHILFPYHSNSSNYLILREIINQSDSILGKKNIYIYSTHLRTCTTTIPNNSSTRTLYRSSRHSANIPRTREHRFEHPGSLVSDKCNARLKTYSLAFLIHPFLLFLLLLLLPSLPLPSFTRDFRSLFACTIWLPDSSGASFANCGPTARDPTERRYGRTCYTGARMKASPAEIPRVIVSREIHGGYVGTRIGLQLLLQSISIFLIG